MHKDPYHVFDSIQGKVFTIKEISALEYFLGRNFDPIKEPMSYNNILTWGSNTYVKLMMGKFKNTSGFEPTKQHADMPPNYKPEINITDLCNDAEKDQYCQSNGEMQWSVSLGRINIMYAILDLSQLRPALRKGYLVNIQHIYSDLNKYIFTSINFNTEIPVHDKFKTIDGKWGNLYDGISEDLPHSCPPPMGNPIPIYSFFDANLMDDLTTGVSQTGIIHLLNKTPKECYYKIKFCI